jgi:hypothetical protein
LPFWPTAAFAVISWLVAWFVAWPVSQWIAFDLLGLEHGSALGEAVAFLLYDVRKVLLLLLGIVTLVSFLAVVLVGILAVGFLFNAHRRRGQKRGPHTKPGRYRPVAQPGGLMAY